ncbi:hypothetical protein NFI96_013197 [Prochilodus magdalenae]|nr:hypothetical protein NFI96_013197 [Prochilodus magdalenae]
MMECLFLLLAVFDFTAGCTRSGERRRTAIRRHTGGSALLSCSCADLQTRPQTHITWEIYRREREWRDVFSDGQYRNRLQQFNKDSPANLSLLISDLREEDEGDYRCQVTQEYRDFRLFVKGCDLVKSEETEEVMRFSGESVVLPCSCTDLQTKPNTVKWEFRSAKHKTSTYEVIYSSQTGQYRDRVRLTNKNSGNLSLLISDLDEEDGGVYRCSVQNDFKYIRLYVEVRETPAAPSKTPAEASTTWPPITPSVSPSGSALPNHQTSSLHLGLGILMALLLLLFGVVIIACRRYRGRRSEPNVTTERHLDRKQKNQVSTLFLLNYVFLTVKTELVVTKKRNSSHTVADDVTYSTITHSNTSTPVLIHTGEQSEYACIKTK